MILAAAADTPLRRALAGSGKRLLRFIPRTSGGKLALALATLAAAILMFQLFKTQAAGLAGPMAGELGVWFAMIDVGTAMDLLAVAVLAVVSVRLKSVVHLVQRLVQRMRRVGRSPRRALRRRPRKPSDDGEPWPQAPALA